MCTAFDDVTKFDPARWERLRTSGKMESLHRFDYIPFSTGKRPCVGQEFARDMLKVFVIEAARLCDWDLVNGVPVINTCPLPFPKDNLPLNVRPYVIATHVNTECKKPSNE